MFTEVQVNSEKKLQVIGIIQNISVQLIIKMESTAITSWNQLP